MSDVVLTHPTFPSGTTAVGSEVIENFEDTLDVVNGLIDDDNLVNNGITASSKLKDGTVSLSKMAAGSVGANQVLWSQSSSGVRAWRTPGYAGTNGSRLIRVEKTITLANVTTEQTFTLDWSGGDSIDGAITFGASPSVSGLAILDTSAKISGAAAAVMNYCVVTSRTVTGCTVKMRFSTAPTAGDVVLMATVMGAA